MPIERPSSGHNSGLGFLPRSALVGTETAFPKNQLSTPILKENLMAKTVADVMKMVKDNEVKFVDFRFTDTRGKEQHVTVPISHFDERQVHSTATRSTVLPSLVGRASKPRTCC
jgi:uncharacterized membrane protein